MRKRPRRDELERSYAERIEEEAMKSGYVEANGVNYYYEIKGEGQPLLVLHGGLGSTELFSPVTPELCKSHEVIAVDLQGHGRSSLGERPIRMADMGDDMAVIVESLGYSQVDALGYSLGAGVALRLAIQHPARVRRLVVVSAGFSTEGFHPEMLPQQAQMSAAAADALKGTPMHESYMRIAPNPDDFPKLLDRMGESMREHYDWSEEIKALEMPIMLVYGDSDMFTTPHMAEFYNLIGGNLRDAGWQRENMSPNRLAILPDQTHYDMAFAPQLVPTVLRFLAD